MTAVRGTFSDFKTVKTRGVCQLIIEVPIEDADHALAVLGGVPQMKAEQWVGVAPIAAAEKPVENVSRETSEPGPEPSPEPPKTGTEDWSEAKRKMVQQSGMLPYEKSFQNYIANGWHVMWNNERHGDASPIDKAAYFIRTSCFVKSRRDLDPEGKSGEAFRELMARYEDSQHGLGEQQQEQRDAGP